MALQNNLKIVLVGDGGAGKTVLLWCYTGRQFQNEHIPTVLETYTAQAAFGDRKIGVEIYDTAGQEDFAQIRNLVYPNTDVFIMCYSCVLYQSLQNINTFWLPETKKVMPHAPFILVGNKLDLKDKVSPGEYVLKEHGDRTIKECNGSFHYQCSAKDESQKTTEADTVKTIFKQALIVGIKAREDPDPPQPPGPGIFTICGCTVL